MNNFTDEEILEAFKTFDLDKNNYIGVLELKHLMINIGLNPLDEEIDEMIKMCDLNGNGQVGWDDFYYMVSNGKKSNYNYSNIDLNIKQKNIIDIKNKKSMH